MFRPQLFPPLPVVYRFPPAALSVVQADILIKTGQYLIKVLKGQASHQVIRIPPSAVSSDAAEYVTAH